MGQVRPARRKRRQMAEINVVPYIDVMLVLLVIFMITAPLLRVGVEIDLPDANAEPLANTGESIEPLILSVDKEGAWYLNISDDPETQMNRADVQALATAALIKDPERPALVAGDTAVEYGDIMQAMAALQLAGASVVSLMSEPPR